MKRTLFYCTICICFLLFFSFSQGVFASSTTSSSLSQLNFSEQTETQSKTTLTYAFPQSVPMASPEYPHGTGLFYFFSNPATGSVLLLALACLCFLLSFQFLLLIRKYKKTDLTEQALQERTKELFGEIEQDNTLLK